MNYKNLKCKYNKMQHNLLVKNTDLLKKLLSQSVVDP